MAGNAMQVLALYRSGGAWVFDEPRFGLVAEPFVLGASEIIDAIITSAGLDHRRPRVRMVFSANTFPGEHAVARRLHPEHGGTWYEAQGRQGWLCPALFHFFPEAPEQIHVRVEPMEAGAER